MRTQPGRLPEIRLLATCTSLITTLPMLRCVTSCAAERSLMFGRDAPELEGEEVEEEEMGAKGAATSPCGDAEATSGPEGVAGSPASSQLPGLVPPPGAVLFRNPVYFKKKTKGGKVRFVLFLFVQLSQPLLVRSLQARRLSHPHSPSSPPLLPHCPDHYAVHPVSPS